MKKITDIMGSKYIVLVILTVTAFIIYYSSTNASFHFDDKGIVTGNASIEIEELSFSTLKMAALTKASGLRPVAYLTFAVNHYFSKGDTTSYHVVNIIIHIVNAFLIYLIIIRLFGAGDDERIRLSALFTALIWLAAPFNSQAVIYIVQRMTLLMTLFFLLAFLMYSIAKERGKKTYYVLCGLFFILSLLSKQNGITFPLVIVLYELIFVREGDITSITKKETGLLIALFALVIIAVMLFRSEISEAFSKGYSIRDHTMTERVLTQFRVLIFYLSLMVLPLPGRLSLTHDIAKSTSLISPVTTLIALLIIVALIAIAIIRMKKSPYLSFALLWYFVTISVESTIIPLEMVFEHRVYLPGIFLVGAAVDFLVRRFYDNKSAVIAILVVIAIAFGSMTAVRGHVWKDDITLWGDVVKKYPDDGRARHNLGMSYYEAGLYKEAGQHVSAAIEKKLSGVHRGKEYTLSKAYHNLGLIKSELGKTYEAEQNFLNAIKHEKDMPFPYSSLGVIYLSRRDYKRAEKMFLEGIRLVETRVPPFEESEKRFTLSRMYLNLGELYFASKKLDQAERSLKTSIGHNKGFALPYDSLGNVFLAKGKYNEALKSYVEAIKLDPGFINPYSGIGKVYAKSADYDNSIKYFKKVIELDKRNVPAYNEIGLVYMKRKMYREAKSYFEKALSYDPNDQIVLRNLKYVEKTMNR